MTEATEKKIKIFNLAKELNLASGTIIEFLTKKGYTIKGPMSIVENDMMKDIMAHFKKDKDVADRHQRKIAEIKETKRKTAEKKKETEEEAKEQRRKRRRRSCRSRHRSAAKSKSSEECTTPNAAEIVQTCTGRRSVRCNTERRTAD